LDELIEITVAYLGGSRDDAGCARETLRVPAGTTVAEVALLVAELHPGLAPRLGHVRWARNFEFVETGVAVAAGDELGVLPPVCGGAPRAYLTTERVDAQEVAASVASPEVGATVLFVGTVRRQSHGRTVERIDYQAYEPMASRQLERIADAAVAESGATDVRIVHRHGSLALGEVTIVIAAAAPHREQAFGACRAALEKVKHDVPIWKREYTTDGAFWEAWGGG
jgi:molybdopterin synthase catalytic subunit/molybdopterin converting factor small subunit